MNPPALAALPDPPAAHEYTALERVLFGRDAAAALAEEVDRLGAQRVFIVTTRSLAGSSQIDALEKALTTRHAGTHAGVRAFAPRACVLEGADAARAAGADLLVAAGGGSVIDACKVMLLCLRHELHDPAQLDTYANASFEPAPGRSRDADRWLRMLAIPSTFSAAEYTARGGSMLESTRKLQAYSHPMLMPVSIIQAPAMTTGTPLPLLLSTGMKAVDHAVERLTSIRANAYSDAVSSTALRYLGAGLRQIHATPADTAAHARVQYGVYLSMAGRASGVTAGLSHAIAHQLGSYSHVGHGQTSCVLLPAVLRWIEGWMDPSRTRLLADALGSPQARAADAVHDLVAALGMPLCLRDVDVARQDLDEIARRTLDDPLVRNCPRPVRGASDVREVLELAW